MLNNGKGPQRERARLLVSEVQKKKKAKISFLSFVDFPSFKLALLRPHLQRALLMFLSPAGCFFPTLLPGKDRSMKAMWTSINQAYIPVEGRLASGPISRFLRAIESRVAAGTTSTPRRAPACPYVFVSHHRWRLSGNRQILLLTEEGRGEISRGQVTEVIWTQR